MYISVVSIRLYMPLKSIFKPAVGKIPGEILRMTAGTLISSPPSQLPYAKGSLLT